jgi:hypothetical protein
MCADRLPSSRNSSASPRKLRFEPLAGVLVHPRYLRQSRDDGRPFEQFKLVQNMAPKLVGSVLIRERNPDTFEDDVQEMLRARLTFNEAVESEDFSLVSKQRLQIVRRELFEQLDALDL